MGEVAQVALEEVAICSYVTLVLARELRKMSEERAIVLHKASEVGWSQNQKDQDGRSMRGESRQFADKNDIFVPGASQRHRKDHTDAS